jgi:hypothetical protein
VEAINGLTARIRAAEEAEGADIQRLPNESERVYTLRRRAEVLERRRAAAAIAAPSPAPGAVQPSPAAAPAVPSSRPAPSSSNADPEPDPNDQQKYPDGVYDRKYITDHTRWAARDEWRQIEAQRAQRAAEAERETRWNTGIAAAKAKYPDFEAVAFAPGAHGIPEGSIVDSWILEHESGAQVLYHLRRNPAELAGILRQSPLQAIQSLALLTQRITTNGAAAAGNGTGSAPAPTVIVQPPRPPNPVRTEATAPDRDGQPDPAAPMSIADHAKHWGPGRR